MAKFVYANNEQLRSQSFKRIAVIRDGLTFNPEMASRRTGRFHAIRMATNITHAAMIVSVSERMSAIRRR